jgi:HD-GYP domain-containing protein (c-di-GMP phosphodiesterase class II)
MAVPPPRKPVIPPVFAPQLHNDAMQALSVLLIQIPMLPAVRDADIEPLRRVAASMADAVIDAHERQYEPAEPVPLRDHHYAHPAKVAELAMLLAGLAGGGRAELRTTCLAAMLMNAGYVFLRPGTLDREGALREDALREMRRHPQQARELFAECGLPDDVIEAIAQHHERWDGSGYPLGLSGKQISIYARIVGAADAYVALCSPRPYRPAYARRQVDELFLVEAGTLFDPNVVRLLLEHVPLRYERHPEADQDDADIAA